MAGHITDGNHPSLARKTGSRILAGLIIINLAVSAVIWLTGLGNKFDLGSYLALSGSWSGFCQRPWGLLTYMVTQTDLLHLLFNILWLYFFGRISLMIMKEQEILFLYIGGGLTGGIVFLLWSLSSPSYMPLMGASASVMALIVSIAVYRPKFRVNLFIFGEVSLLLLAVISIALTFFGAGGGNSGGQAAHIGGLLFGLWAGWMLRRGTDLIRIFKPLTGKISDRIAHRRAEKADRRRHANDELLSGIRGRLADRERLDELLDKIRASGYNSLTKTERAELNALSNRLDSRD